jgi:circadian clock protein KaiC
MTMRRGNPWSYNSLMGRRFHNRRHDERFLTKKEEIACGFVKLRKIDSMSQGIGGKGKVDLSSKALKKVPTGIGGFDEITGGGLPAGRPTLVCGGAGCGKSLFSTEFLVRGALQFNEPGILMTFEETLDDIKKNVASLGFDIEDLIARKKLYVDHVRVERSEIEENGEYDLEGLFIRLSHAIKTIGAKRVVLDTIETLFSGLSNQAILRAEVRRLFGWLKDHGMTTVITGERGEGALTRQGLEEYVSDCVILLDHRVHGQISTRRMRVVKYRGSTHGTNEYPFLIDEKGISVLPITAAGMDYGVSTKRVSSGVPELDDMLGGKGFYVGSTILLSGSAGTGKTSMAAHLADSTCKRGERCLYFSFEESQSQIIRNMKSIGLDLEPHVGCCNFIRRARRSSAWRCTWSCCIRRWRNLSPRSPFLTRSPTCKRPGRWMTRKACSSA